MKSAATGSSAFSKSNLPTAYWRSDLAQESPSSACPCWPIGWRRDPSPEMIAQAQARNAPAVATGRVELRRGAAARLPFESNTFDKAVAVNSRQVWPDAIAGLRELRRVLKPGGR